MTRADLTIVSADSIAHQYRSTITVTDGTLMELDLAASALVGRGTAEFLPAVHLQRHQLNVQLQWEAFS